MKRKKGEFYEKKVEAFSHSLSRLSFWARMRRVIEALKGRSVGSIERIFDGDCERIDNAPTDDPQRIGVRFDEGKMVNFFLEKVYPSGAPDGLFETLLEKMVSDEDASGYLFFRECESYDDEECTYSEIVYDFDDADVDFYIPEVYDENFCENFFLTCVRFCENFFLCYLELRLDDYRAQKRRSKE